MSKMKKSSAGLTTSKHNPMTKYPMRKYPTKIVEQISKVPLSPLRASKNKKKKEQTEWTAFENLLLLMSP